MEIYLTGSVLPVLESTLFSDKWYLTCISQLNGDSERLGTLLVWAATPEIMALSETIGQRWNVAPKGLVEVLDFILAYITRVVSGALIESIATRLDPSC